MRATSIFAASAFLIAFLVEAPLARAEISVEFECIVPTSSSFDCNLLKTTFLKESPLPYVKEEGTAKKPARMLKVSVSQLPGKRVNENEYTVEVKDKKGPYFYASTLPIPSIMDPAAANMQIIELLQQGVNGVARPSAATIVDGNATVVYSDPAGGGPVASKKSEGRWILSPGVSLYFSKYGDTASTYNTNGSLTFNYSGDRVRYRADAFGSFNRQSVTVIKNDKAGIYGVNTHGGYADASASIGLDSGNHYNLGVGVGAVTDRLANIDKSAWVSLGFEYNHRPTLEKDSMAFAAGCRVGSEYYDFDVDNYLGKNQLVDIYQACTISMKVLIDKQRGSAISGKVGEKWIVTHPNVVGINGNVSADFKITDRWTVSPSVNVSKKTKSIVATSPDYDPSFVELSAQDTAAAQLYYGAQTSSGSAFSATGSVNLSYTIGDGITRAARDQRGTANH